MVLKVPDDSGTLMISAKSIRGLTLVELLIAISLSTVVVGLSLALFKDAGFAARLGAGNRDAAFQARAAFGAISENLMTGNGIVELGPDKILVLNRANRRTEYRLEDSTLRLNGKPFGFKVAAWTVEPEGPQRPEGNGFSVGTPWDLDSLDGDRDGRIPFDELDRDRSGALDDEECRFIATVKLSLNTVYRGISIVQTAVVHPRNRVPGVAESGVENNAAGFHEEGGIPEP
ncbi:MAG: prepilin-type N-terminal cleavage/methylation domain-containing protein [Fibrobacteria bacterium]